MNRFAGLAIGLLVLVGSVGYHYAVSEPPVAARPVSASRVESTAHPEWVALGVASCAAQACHGSARADLPPSQRHALSDPCPADSWKTSYLRWGSIDPHARAFAVSESQRSQNIVDRLEQVEARAQKRDVKVQATLDKRCLACHVNPSLAERTDPHSRALHAEGISCEACHGNAGQRRDEHLKWNDRHAPRFRLRPGRHEEALRPGRARQGLRRLPRPPPAKGSTPLRDVNHDLIAAGHPRLNFEFAAYLRRLPPHWVEKDRLNGRARPKGFEAQVWLVGKAAVAEARLELLASRQNKLDLAEFSCFACHHDLPSWRNRQTGYFGQAAPGSLRWLHPWGPDERSGNANEPDLATALTATDQIAEAMERSKAPLDLHVAIRLATQMWETYRRRVAAPDFHADLVATGKLLEPPDWDRLDWDSAASLYYGVVAVHNAKRHQGRAADAEMEKTLSDLFEKLRLRREQFDSPANFSPEQIKLDLQRGLDLLLGAIRRRGKRRVGRG